MDKLTSTTALVVYLLNSKMDQSESVVGVSDDVVDELVRSF